MVITVPRASPVLHLRFAIYPACAGLGDPQDPVHGGALDWLRQLRSQPPPVRAAPPGKGTLAHYR